MKLLIALIVLAAHPQPGPGLWEFTVESTIDGRQMPLLKSTRCFTEEELKKKRAEPHAASSGCTITTTLDEPGRVIQTYRCEKLDSFGTREVTYTKDGWMAVTKGTVRGKAATQQLTMRRISDCR